MCRTLILFLASQNSFAGISNQRLNVQGGGDVESNGTRNFRDRHAPGQNCFYTPSGDHRTELYRLAAYAKYPDTTPVKPGNLASSGLYFTGYKDRVKCFSCGMAVENWIQGDDCTDKQWHKSDCRLIKGTDIDNIALPTLSFRTLLRAYRGLTTSLTGTPSAASNQAGTPRDVTDVTRNLGQVRLTETNFPVITLANITTPRHEAYLKRINLRSEEERRKTYEQWPSYPAPHLVGELAKDGFFYLGNLDRTQCFACSGVLRNWSGNDVVRDQHRKHFPRCGFVLGLNVGNVSMTNSVRERAEREERARLEQLNANHGEPPDSPQDQQRHLTLAYPCNNPINRHMVSLQRRIETFNTRWPSNRINAAVEDIAKAGFFFLGESDKTKCFYCNGGLQNWEPNDEPWTEHAKWFPGCEFVLRKKGVDFARTIADAHPNLSRPYIRNPVPFHDIPPSDVRRTGAGEMMETTPSTSAIDTERIINDMGFGKAAIVRAMERRRNEGGVFCNTEELVQYLLDHSDEDRNEVLTASGASSSGTASAAGRKRKGAQETSEGNKKTRRSTSPLSTSSIGESDKTKCLYCNGGLQNWDPNDKPWTEHAKWFPGSYRQYYERCLQMSCAAPIPDAEEDLPRLVMPNPAEDQNEVASTRSATLHENIREQSNIGNHQEAVELLATIQISLTFRL